MSLDNVKNHVLTKLNNMESDNVKFSSSFIEWKYSVKNADSFEKLFNILAEE